MGKRVPEKNRCIIVNLHHDGVFSVSPFEYAFGDEKQMTDIHFECMSYVRLREVIVKLVHGPVVTLYYCKVCTPLKLEHSGYDALDIRDQEETIADDDNESSDAYFSSDEEDLNEPVFANDETVVEDSENIDPKFNVKSGVTYIRHNPNQNWKKMKHVLGMRFDNPEQLKMCLANYGVGNGYQLWFYKNDWRKLLVYYGKDVEAGRCAGSRSKIDEDTSKSPKTPVKAIASGEGCSESPNLATSNTKDDRKKPAEMVKAVQLRCHKEEGEGEWVKEEEVVEEMTEDEVRKNLEHDYMDESLLQEEQKLQDYETKQDEFDQEALRLTLEEEAMYKRMDEDRLKEQMAEEEWDMKIDYYHPSNWTQEEESFDHEPYNKNVNTLDANVQTQEAVAGYMSNRGEIGFRLGDYEAEELGKQLAEPIVAVTPCSDDLFCLIKRQEIPTMCEI
nr:hypothetical protein [Tanacetum cinerariifolium]